MKFLLDIFKGLFIGAGAILPGISSGVFCVIFGIYEKLVDSILNFFKDFKKNLLFLLPLAIGGFIGIFIFGNILNFVFNEYKMQTSFAFIGLILGCIPILIKKANSHKGFRLHYVGYLLIAFLIGVISIGLESIGTNFITDFNNNFFFLIFSGFLMSVGIVVPGVSSTVILMKLGIYPKYLNAVSVLDLSVLIPMGIGVLTGGVIFLKLVQFLLTNYFTQSFYAIIGFVLGSVLVLYPGFSFNFSGVISIILFIVCFYIALQFEKLEKD